MIMRLACLVVALFSLASFCSPTVFADGNSCPEGLPQLDCEAIVGGLQDYVPITGSRGGTAIAGACSSTTLTGSDGVQKAYNYFIGKGLNDILTSAVVANLKQESGLNPTILQKGGNSNNPADADSGPDGLIGWGIAQWSPGSKVIGIAKDLGITGPIYELATQLDIVYGEMQGTAPTGYANFLADFEKQTTLEGATEFFRANFEGGTEGNRQQYAQEIHQMYGGTTPTTTTADTSSSATSETASQSRQAAVCLLQAELDLWESGQLKPGSSEPYDFYKYSYGVNDEWCGYFVSWIYDQAGYPIDKNANHGIAAAVQGIWDIGEAGNGWTFHAASGYTPSPGDLVIHKENGKSHVNMVLSVDNNSMMLVGGNQSGTSTANNSSRVSSYKVTGFSGVDDITGYVVPNE